MGCGRKFLVWQQTGPEVPLNMAPKMRCNDAGLLIIKKYEGLVDGDPDTPGLDPYRCPAGVPTIGFGSTHYPTGRKVQMADPPITKAYAQKLLDIEMESVEGSVARLIRHPLNVNQFSALCSWVYNLGSGRLQSSTLRSKLNRGDVDGAAAEFPKWRRAGGRILLGLVLRRAAERQLFEA